jgi:hypothetical protein
VFFSPFFWYLCHQRVVWRLRIWNWLYVSFSSNTQTLTGPEHMLTTLQLKFLCFWLYVVYMCVCVCVYVCVCFITRIQQIVRLALDRCMTHLFCSIDLLKINFQLYWTTSWHQAQMVHHSVPSHVVPLRPGVTADWWYWFSADKPKKGFIIRMDPWIRNR